jgi:hypothetical protein
MSTEKEFGVLHFIGEKYVCRMDYNPIHFEENIIPVIGKMKIVDFNHRIVTSKKRISTR